MGDVVTGEVVEQRLFEQWMVVPVVERARAGEEVEVLAALLVVHVAAARCGERGGPAAAVAAHLRLESLEDVHVLPFVAGSNGPIRKSTSAWCVVPAGKWLAVKSTSRFSTGTPLARAKPVKSAAEAALSGVTLAS